MAYSNSTPPYTVNIFTNNPPTGGITQSTQNQRLTGFIASSASFGVAVSAFEVSGRAFIAFYRMYGNAGRLTLTYQTSDGTAQAGVDYTAVSGTVVWEDGDITSRVVQVPLLSTSKIINQFFNFSITHVAIGTTPLGGSAYIFLGGNLNPFPGPNYALSTTFPVTIIRPGNGQIALVGSTYQVQDPNVGTTTVTVQAQRFNGFRGAVSCSFHTTDGTAIAGLDYTALSGTLSWADGEGGTKNMVITILGRAGVQPNRDFTVTIDNPTGGATIGSPSVATVTIVEAAPTPNPTPGGSIPNYLQDYPLIMEENLDGGAPSTFWWRSDFFDDPVTAFWRNNITFNGILCNKIGSFIGFCAGTDSFGGGTDFVDGTPFFNPLSRFRFQGHIV